MLKVEDFTNKELVSAIVKWIRAGEHLNFASEYADSLEDGSWLEYYNRKLQNEPPHFNS